MVGHLQHFFDKMTKPDKRPGGGWAVMELIETLMLHYVGVSPAQCGKFVLRGGYLRRAILMLSIYLLLNFRNLRRAISKLSSLVSGVEFTWNAPWRNRKNSMNHNINVKKLP
jgi:hypothetical protein